MAIVLAWTIGSCWATSEMPVPRRRRSVTVAAAARATNGSSVRRYSSGSSGPPGHGVRRLVGMCVCSVTHSDSKPRSSSSRRQAGRAGSRGRSGRSARRCASAATVRRRRRHARTREHPVDGCREVRQRDVLRFPAGRCSPARRMVDEPGGEWKARERLICASVVRESKRVRWWSTQPGWSAVQSGGERSVCSANLMLSVPPRKDRSSVRTAGPGGPVCIHDPALAPAAVKGLSRGVGRPSAAATSARICERGGMPGHVLGRHRVGALGDRRPALDAEVEEVLVRDHPEAPGGDGVGDGVGDRRRRAALGERLLDVVAGDVADRVLGRLLAELRPASCARPRGSACAPSPGTAR